MLCLSQSGEVGMSMTFGFINLLNNTTVVVYSCTNTCFVIIKEIAKPQCHLVLTAGSLTLDYFRSFRSFLLPHSQFTRSFQLFFCVLYFKVVYRFRRTLKEKNTILIVFYDIFSLKWHITRLMNIPKIQ